MLKEKMVGERKPKMRQLGVHHMRRTCGFHVGSGDACDLLGQPMVTLASSALLTHTNHKGLSLVS